MGKFSNTLVQIIEGNHGFNTIGNDDPKEALSNAFDILEREVLELTNSSIQGFCKDNYDVSAKGAFNFVRELEKYLVNIFNTDKLYAVWLTSLDHLAGQDAVRYELPELYLVVCDDRTRALIISPVPLRKWKHKKYEQQS